MDFITFIANSKLSDSKLVAALVKKYGFTVKDAEYQVARREAAVLLASI